MKVQNARLALVQMGGNPNRERETHGIEVPRTERSAVFQHLVETLLDRRKLICLLGCRLNSYEPVYERAGLRLA